MAVQGRTVEQVLARLASRRHGVVARRELLRAGLTRHEIAERIADGSLIPIYRGVYRVGHAAPSTDARYLAAVLACGDRALLTGPPAAHLFGLTKGSAPPPEVIAPTERRVKGVGTRRSRRMDPRDATVWRAIPVTTVPRTLVDLAARLSSEDLARAFHEAGIRHHITPEQVEAVLERHPNAPGAGALRRVLRGERSPPAASRAGSSSSLPTPTSRSPKRIAGPAPTSSTAVGRPPASRSSSTATATTARGTRGSRTAGGARGTRPAVTGSVATPTATCSRSPPRWSASSGHSFRARSAHGGSRSARSGRGRACRACETGLLDATRRSSRRHGACRRSDGS
jgi:Transcriptional regulator, AbiEi antitoxin